MKKLTDQDPETKSPDIVAENIEQLKVLFPEAFTEGKIDFEILKQLLGNTIDEREEKYGLNWHGKRQARQIALTPSTGTLRPCPEDSVDWDTTQNLMIEGDNLEVLKLLQKSYAGRISLIYIDPPYNTGNDFIYPDNFRNNLLNYLELTGQLENGNKISVNTESSGRFHSDWLSMMYPRLKLAKNLLQKDGIILISIDDNEIDNLKKICDEIYNEENYLGMLSWIRRTKPINSGDAKYQLQQKVEYVLVYCRNKNRPNTYAFELPISEERKYNQDGKHGKCRFKDIEDSDIGGKNRDTMKFPILGVKPGEGKRWKIGAEEAKKLIDKDRVRIIDGKVRIEIYPDDEEPFIYRPFWSHFDTDTVKTAEDGKADLNELLEAKIGFDTVKPLSLIETILDFLPKNIFVLDFFAGTGTTAHSVWNKSAHDNGNRRSILVQLPEPLNPDKKDEKAAADFCDGIDKPRNIAEITKERLRRAGNKIRKDNPTYKGDLGFRVFKLDSSNIREWDPDRDDIATTLEEHAEHLKTDRTENDILFELLLKLGLDLTVPIEQKKIAGKTVHSIGAGTLLVCLSDKISTKEAETLALGITEWHKILAPSGESTIVFRDSAFTDDVAKTNITAILQQYGLENVKSL